MKTYSIPQQSIMSRLSLWHQNRQAKKQLVEHVVETVDPKIRLARGYQKKLEMPIQTCLEYCKAMVVSIPGPTFLKSTDYDNDPLIHAVFMASEGIKNLLLKQDTTLISSTPSESDRYGLLTMAHNETTIFGPKVQGDMVLGDVPMQSVTFTDHKIVGLSTTFEASQDKLEELCFQMILESVSRELAAKRTNLGELHEHIERLHALSKMFSDGTQAKNYFGHSSHEDLEKLNKVEKMLQESEEEFVHARQGNETPQDWLEILIDHLKMPEKIMHIDPITLRLDWKNVLTDDPDEKANTFTLAQCSLTDDIKRDAVLIAYSMEK